MRYQITIPRDRSQLTSDDEAAVIVGWGWWSEQSSFEDQDGDGVKETLVKKSRYYKCWMTEAGVVGETGGTPTYGVSPSGFHSWGGTEVNPGVGSTPGQLKLRAIFDVPAEVAGDVAFTLSGTAVEGTHYTVETPSPVVFAAGDSGVDVYLQMTDLSPSKWFEERTIIVTLVNGTQTIAALDSEVLPGVREDALDFHVDLRATDTPPLVDWNTASTSEAAGGSHSVQVDLDTASGDDVTVYYTVTGAGAGDITIDAGKESGALTINDGVLNTQLTFTSDVGGAGKDVVFTIDHEASDRSEENQFLHTDDWRLEEDSRRFPGEPTNSVSGGGTFAAGAPDEVEREERGIIILVSPSDTAFGPDNDFLTANVTGPDGRYLQAVICSPWPATGSQFYIRESFEPGLFSMGAPSGLKPMRAYVHFSNYRAEMPSGDTWRDWPFYQISLRNRSKSINHRVVFRGARTATPDNGGTNFTDAYGNVVTPVNVGGWYWAFFWGNQLYTKWQSLTGDVPWLSQYGVVSETRGGVAYPRFWLNHYGTPVSGTATAGTTGTTLEDTGKTFVTTDLVEVGDTVIPSAEVSAVYSDGAGNTYNAAKVTAITETTVTVDNSLTGIIASGDAYDIRKTYNDDKPNPNDVVEKVNSDGMNPLLRTTYFANELQYDSAVTQVSSDIVEAFFGTGSTASQLARDGRGAIIFDPFMRRQDGQIKTPPTFWEKKGMWWRPRGLAVEGTTLVHTFSLT